MCTRIRFLGWAPGSRVPSQAPTISGSPAAIMGSGMIANPGISVNPNQSPNDNARYLFMVDLLIELQPKSARSQSGITLFRCLSPTTAIVEFRLLVSAMQILPESPFMASWLPQAYTRLWPASALAGLQERERPQGVHTDRPCPLLREHAAVLLHKPELTRGYQRPYRRLSGHGPETAFWEITPGESRSRHGAWDTRRRGPWHMLRLLAMPARSRTGRPISAHPVTAQLPAITADARGMQRAYPTTCPTAYSSATISPTCSKPCACSYRARGGRP